VKSDQSPLLWLLLVLFVSPVGIIVYLLAGRTKKDEPAPGKYKKAIIAAAICFVLSTGLFAAGLVTFVTAELEGFSTGFGSVSSGVSTVSRSQVRNNVWTYTARSKNGWERRSPNLTAEQLANFHVLSDSGEGVLLLRLEQGDVSETIDISGFFDQQINMSAFEAGRVRITIEFSRARDVDITINWQ
jgi:hypothetical protein